MNSVSLLVLNLDLIYYILHSLNLNIKLEIDLDYIYRQSSLKILQNEDINANQAQSIDHNENQDIVRI